MYISKGYGQIAHIYVSDTGFILSYRLKYARIQFDVYRDVSVSTNLS